MASKLDSSTPCNLPSSTSAPPRSLSVLCVNTLPNRQMDQAPPKTPQTPKSVAAEHHHQTPQSKQLPPHQDTPHQTPHYLSQLLQGATEWPHSDEALTEALKLRQEQERTKQEYYRLENRKRTLEILTMATRAGVPGPAITALFDGQVNTRAAAVAAATATAGAVGSMGGPQMAPQPHQRSSRAGSPELVNYEDVAANHQRSPSRFRPTHVRSASAVPAFSARPITQAYYPQRMPVQQQSSLQFHHWKPNQRPDEKKKLERSPKQLKQEPNLQSSPPNPASQQQQPQPQQQQQQPTQQQQQQQQPPQAIHQTPPQPQRPQHQTPGSVHASPSPAPAVVAAAHQQQRRKQHSRHRSEAAIPSARAWYQPNRTEEGVSILASMASERTKHDVGFILAPDRSPAHAHNRIQSSPRQGNLGPPPPHFFGQPGPVATSGQTANQDPPPKDSSNAMAGPEQSLKPE